MTTEAPDTPGSERTTARARVAVALAGVGSSAAQVVVVRELLVASAGNELSIAAVLAAWLLWSAAGAWFGGRVLAGSRREPLWHLTMIALAELAVLALALGLARGGLYALREMAGGVLVQWHVAPPAGGTVSLPQLLLLTTLVTAPVGVLLGWQFAAGCALLRRDGAPSDEGAAGAYVADSVGHLLGGAALSVTAVTRVPGDWVLTTAAVVVLGGVWLLRPTVGRLGVGIALTAVLLLGGAAFRERTLGLRWAPHRLTASLDGPAGNVAVLTGAGAEQSYFANGVHAFETAGAPAGEQWVHLPLLAHPAPRRVLLVGGGPRALREVLRHDPEQVRYFELDPTIVQAVRTHAPPALRTALDDPRVEVSLRDARLRLPALIRRGERYDVVLVALGDPTTAQVNRYYTLRWFRLARRALAPEGMVACHVMSSGDYLNDELRAYNACVFHTAQRAGFAASVFPGEQMTLVGAQQPEATALFDDALALDRRLRTRGLDPATVLAAFYDALDPLRREDRRRELEQATGVRLNDDFTPACYYYAQTLWASWWRGPTGLVLARAQRLQAWHVAALAAAVTLLLGALARCSRTGARITASCAVFVAGAGGMTLEVVLLIALQSLYGHVYGIVGYAVGVLMAGLALGAWLARRRPAARPHRALAGTLLGLALAAGLTGVALVGLRFLTGLAAPTGVLPVAAIALLMGVTGVAAGATFPRALAVLGDADVRGATALYAFDLVGAACGALLAGLILVPLLGITATCIITAVIAASSSLMTYSETGDRHH
jgi:spermidine synthase